MPLLRKGVVMPVKGIDYSIPSTFISDQSGFPKNMYYYRGELRKRPGKTLVGASAISGGQIMGLGKLEIFSGVKYAVRTSKTKIQYYNSTTGVWDSISLSDFTGGDDDFFSFATVTEDGLLIISNGVNVIRKWPGSGNTAALGGNPPKAKYMAYLSPYLILAHIDDGATINPWKYQWCDVGNSEVWTGGSSGSDTLGDEASPIQNILKLNEFAAVYKKESLWILNKVSTADVFQKNCIRTGIGLAAPRAVADADGQHYFMALNDFYVWNAANQPTPIGGPVRDEVFSRLDRSKMNRCFAIHVQELTEIWFFIVTTGNSWPTEVWKYNYRNGFWYYDTCSELTAAMKWERVSSEAWNDDTPGSWDEALDIWDSGDSIQDWEEILFGNTDGNTMKLDYTKADDLGVAVEGVFETKDFIGNSLELKARWLQIDFWARGSSGAKLYVDYAIDGSSTWVNIPKNSSQAYLELTETATQYNLYFDIYASKIRFRVRNSESGEIFYIKAFFPYYLSKEQRR